MTVNEGIAVAGFLIAALGLIWTIYTKATLEKRQYALQIFSEWNRQTAADRMTLERAFPGIYQHCIPLSTEEARALSEARLIREERRGSFATDSPPVSPQEARDAAIRLLNYFEFISQAALNRAADRRIITESFLGTMTRFYCQLGAFVEAERNTTKRNPWAPYSRFVFEAVRSRRTGLKDGTCLGLSGKGTARAFVCQGSGAGGCDARTICAPLPDADRA